MNSPLVTVLCLCYNHARFVAEAIDSVFAQTYQPIQLIVVDDGSADNSAQVIEQMLRDHSDVLFLKHTHNQGYCASLNEALKHAKGEFIIDLSGDDVLLPQRVSSGVVELNRSGERYGVSFSDAILITELGETMGLHSANFPHAAIPTGDIYAELINRYFICPPTLMFRRSVIERIGGYDESLAFEDFDFLIRASRDFYFTYSRQPLVKRRIVKNSMSAHQFKRNSPQRWSTYQVCLKIKGLNRSRIENQALQKRLLYETIVSIRLLEFGLATRFLKMLLSVVFAR
ncbi:MAG: glycosyltransferase family 2 protein, partial [Bacteroidota bacterium]|nr:glycosyltransferase family 2 protein [Cytophagales bacterium]MCE2957732.1 glycosyltransferase family 2 protein [Flammeovirgaceae bacterium]MCZ8071712.1 glycosyltransferase family A protein [Cytophagales bacterium]